VGDSVPSPVGSLGSNIFPNLSAALLSKAIDGLSRPPIVAAQRLATVLETISCRKMTDAVRSHDP